ncbi:hypothetical protein [Bacillus salipaludis]
MVPDDHLLRLIDKYIDFSFLLEKVRPYKLRRLKRTTWASLLPVTGIKEG